MMNTGRTMLVALSATLVLPCLASAAASADPLPPGEMTLGVVGYEGTGCPPGPDGKVEVSLKKDHTGFTVRLGSMAAQDGAGSGPDDYRKQCDLFLDYHIPSSHTFAVRPVDYTVRGQLQSGASAVLTSRIFFPGDPGPLTRVEKLSGPFRGVRQLRGPDTELKYKACGEDPLIRIQTGMLIDIGTSDKNRKSFLELPNADVYEFAWKECPAPPRPR
ncbi:DUF4360 domain-containing protein [Actinomadura decatromicini]|uniref:DUF4360 domain-containing protein n=1 Tax=Actinomadura decatromicini TaxID=2604572 RepID=A0A5D3FWF2_9ACTN|nr:DUF4360 domain-containing protein [Actinomadura decatromicini]TYK52454.1 DUF4360 domain-containing protein [Actinomadura decatromicini]